MVRRLGVAKIQVKCAENHGAIDGAYSKDCASLSNPVRREVSIAERLQ
jgi:hypothetical protein